MPRLWAKPSPVAGLTLDAYRHILYLRLQSGAVQARLTRVLGMLGVCGVRQRMQYVPPVPTAHQPAAAEQLGASGRVLAWVRAGVSGALLTRLPMHCALRQRCPQLMVVLSSAFYSAAWQRGSVSAPGFAADKRHGQAGCAALQVFDLGPSGQEASPKRVADVHDFTALARQAAGAASHLHPSPAPPTAKHVRPARGRRR